MSNANTATESRTLTRRIAAAAGAVALATGVSAAAATPAQAATQHYLPFPAGETYTVTQAAGSDYSHADEYNAHALDIAMPNQFEVSSSSDGTVKFVGWDERGGNALMVETEPNKCTQYLHLDRSLVGVGDQVKRGQIVAWSGGTGAGVTGPHLHWNVVDCTTWKSLETPNTVEYGTEFYADQQITSQNERS